MQNTQLRTSQTATEPLGIDPIVGGSSAQQDTVHHSSVPPNPEVPEKPVRRRYTAEYKLKILKSADSCKDPGSLAALLRKEGLYSSNLTCWRRQQQEGTLKALEPKKRGRKAHRRDPLALENEKLRKENEQLKKRLKQVEMIIDVQKKISQIVGIPLKTPDQGEND